MYLFWAELAQYAPRTPTGPHHHILTPKIAVDCEMMQSNIGPVLGRVSVVNYHSQTIFDTFVYHPPPICIIDTREPFSGIRWHDIEPRNGAMAFSEVQATLQELLRGRVVIGHAIHNDLRVIRMDLSNPILWLRTPRRGGQMVASVSFDMAGVRDTQKYGWYGFFGRGAQGPSLKDLALGVLGRAIKQGRTSSVEDAIATMEAYRCWEMEIDWQQGGQV